MSTIEVKVPDIGDFTDVPIIEVFVKPGDTVKAEDSLVTLESDKATMDVPAPSGGVVKELKVKLGDKVREGSVILTLESAGAAAPVAKATAATPAPAAEPSPAAASAPAGPAATTVVKVPDIGDFKDVPIIEVFVKVGDAVKAEDSLVSLESEKATMDVPAPAAGTVKELKVKLGDKVSEGSMILMLEAAGGTAPAAAATSAAAPSAPSAAPVAASVAAPSSAVAAPATPGAPAGAPINDQNFR